MVYLDKIASLLISSVLESFSTKGALRYIFRRHRQAAMFKICHDLETMLSLFEETDAEFDWKRENGF